jgi:predicted site-specific integrase-resolvase
MLTAKQAAGILNVSVETLKKWRRRGKGPRFVRYQDGAVRYPLSALMQFLQDCTIAA